VLYGVVVKWNPIKKYGFIGPDRGPDVFFHVSAFGACQVMHIELGQPVQYELDPATVPQRRKFRKELDEPPEVEVVRPVARMVEFIERIPGARLDEIIDSARIQHHPKARQRKPIWRKKSE
jgi:cold shock CspA family protein